MVLLGSRILYGEPTYFFYFIALDKMLLSIVAGSVFGDLREVAPQNALVELVVRLVGITFRLPVVIS